MEVEYDSDLEDIFDRDSTDNIVSPYSFEPTTFSSNGFPDDQDNVSEDSDTDQSVSEEKSTRPVSEWCSCGNCLDMPTEVECRCCQTTNIVDNKAEGLQCITHHEGFVVNCLNIHVLETSYYDHIIQNGPLREEELIHEVYRYLAYRRFTRWVYGLLGKKNRRVIPSCAVIAIRKTFPSEHYAGFKYPQ